MRLFIAIELSASVRTALESVQQEIRRKMIKGRFSPGSNLHLTLSFLGETKPELAQGLTPFLQEVANLEKPFSLRFAKQLRYFGVKKPVGVVWLGLHGELKPLRQLQGLVVQAVEKAGLSQEERPYIPHITMARNCVFSPEVLLAQGEIEILTPRPPAFEVTGFSLMISELMEGKRVYRALERFTFPKAGL